MTTRKTKLLTTIGPATSSYEKLKGLYLAGANAFRLNFSHGSHEDHQKIIDYTQQINEELNANISLVADLQGPKLRIGDLTEPILLKTNQEIILTTSSKNEQPTKIPVAFEKLARDIKVKEKILIDDGKIELVVTKILNTKEIVARVKNGGWLKSRKGFNLPNTRLSVPSLTPKDLHDLTYILTQPIDWIALSFVRVAEDIQDLRDIIQANEGKKHIKIIAKIEKPEAVANIDAIIKASDALMIARGDLGVEIPFQTVPVMQKRIIKKAIRHAKPVIIATHILESMIDNPRATRAEVTDVANGVLDGADMLMLSGETSVGSYPIESVKTMDKIIRHTEKEKTIYHRNLTPDKESDTFLSDAICFNACKISEDVDAKAIIGMTYSGYTAFMLSSYRPLANIYIFTSNREILNTLNLIWGIEVFYYNNFVGTDETINDVLDILKQKEKLKTGDIVVNIGSMPIVQKGRTNMIKMTTIK
jgi:pyruvate kinase